jgi:hypothetical protein
MSTLPTVWKVTLAGGNPKGLQAEVGACRERVKTGERRRGAGREAMVRSSSVLPNPIEGLFKFLSLKRPGSSSNLKISP